MRQTRNLYSLSWVAAMGMAVGALMVGMFYTLTLPAGYQGKQDINKQVAERMCAAHEGLSVLHVEHDTNVLVAVLCRNGQRFAWTQYAPEEDNYEQTR